MIVLLTATICLPAIGQVGLTGTTPRGALDLGSSSTMGFVFPRVALTDAASATITAPDGSAIVVGTVVYNTTANGSGNNRVYPGLYVWTGSKWTNQTSRKDYTIRMQNATLRTGSDDITYGDQSVSFNNNTFTPLYSGDYKVLVHVHYGGGDVDDPDTGSSQYVNMNKQEGVMTFTLNGTDHTYTLNTYAAKNYIPGSDITNNTNLTYDNEINQMNFVFVESFTEGTSYSFSLTMNQADSDGFEADGDESGSLDGRGYIELDDLLRCTVEFEYIGN